MSIRLPATIGLLITIAAPALAQPSFEQRWRERVRAFEQENATLPADAKTVVLLGSSSMEGWRYSNRVSRFLPAGQRYLNRGISGDGIGAGSTGVGNRLESSVFGCKPKVVFLLNGHNSVGSNGSGLEKTARIYREVVEKIRARVPDARLVLVTCQPTKGNYASMAPHLVRLNERIRQIAADTGCGLIDLHAQLVGPDGLSPRPGLSSDGLHMTDAGYEILGREIARVLAEPSAPTPPAPPPVTPPAPPVTPPAPPAGDRVHIVKPGDTLSRIAQKYGTTVACLVELNGIENKNLIHVGQRIKLPPAPASGGLVGGLTGN